MSTRNQLAIFVALALPLFLALRLAGQQEQSGMGHMHEQPGQAGTAQMHQDAQQEPLAAQGAIQAMSHDHMEMNPHMYMTTVRSATPDDQKRAEQILDTLRQSIDKYKDYRVALGEGYQLFAPNLPTKQKHFTNWGYAYEAEFAFDSAHPTSLLYQKSANGGWKLLGAMYTAPRRFTEDQLNQRVPLSVARWHKHVNLCMPPRGAGWNADWKKFGFAGSIATEEACREASGRWVPQIFGWMVHVYPFEQDAAKIWAH